jgi:hypothetical protein
MAKLNINPERKVAKDFSPTPFTRRLGPKPAAGETSPVSEVQQDANQEVEYNDWQVMNNFDEGLRQALISWIDTTKEGKVLTNATGSTRSKTINFQFYGNPSKDVIGAGDIGEFSLQFKYTKRIVRPQASNLDTLTR